jgi:hypothetical protein
VLESECLISVLIFPKPGLKCSVLGLSKVIFFFVVGGSTGILNSGPLPLEPCPQAFKPGLDPGNTGNTVGVLSALLLSDGVLFSLGLSEMNFGEKL